MDKLVFRKIDYERDLQSLFLYMTDPDTQSLVSEQFEVNTIQKFDRWLTSRFEMGIYHDFYMADMKDGRTVGFTFAYDFSVNDGHCKYTVCLYDGYRKSGLGAFVAVMMLRHLFKVYPLRQVFASVYDYNHGSLSANIKGGFEEVGAYPEYRYFDGKYHDLHLLRITREQFNNKYSKKER